MVRRPLILALATSLCAVAACSDINAPHRSGSDDGQQVGDSRGKRNDPQPHADLVPSRGEAQPGDVQRQPEARREPEIRREPQQRQEPQPGDNRRGRGKDDPAKHG